MPDAPDGAAGVEARDVRRSFGRVEALRGMRLTAPYGEVMPPVWPWGLGFDVLLGVGAFALTVRRLRAPVHRLPRGVRIA